MLYIENMWTELFHLSLVVLLLLSLICLYVWIKLRPPRPLQAVASRFSLSGVTLINPGQERRESQTIQRRKRAHRANRE